MAGTSVVEISTNDVEEVDSEAIHFAMFKRLGASIAFGKEGEQASLPGNASLLAVSNIYGAVVFADARGLYAARTDKLIKLAEAAKGSGESQVAEGEDGVTRVPDLEGIHTLTLSADELLLAVCANGRVLLFSMQDLIEKTNLTPRLTLNLSARTVAWSPTHARTLLAVLDDNTLRVGDVSKGLQGPSRDDVIAASWSPDGRHLALASSEGVISIATSDLSATVATFKPALSVRGADDAHHVRIDTLKWIRPNAMLLSLVAFNEDGSETDEAPLVALETSGASFADGGGEVREVLFDGLSPSILSEATDANTGPYLHSAFVQEWKVILVANRKSYDDHINLVGWRDEGGEEALRQWQIDDDTYIPRVDMPESGEDNFVVGLAIDRTSTQIQLYDPRDSSGETKLPPQPVMLYVTSEGTLNAFAFARLDEAKDLPNLVTATRPTFAPLEDLQAPPRAATTPESPNRTPTETPKQAPPSERGDDVSRLRAAAAEAAERRAAEARAAQGHALPPGDDDADLLEEPASPPPQAAPSPPTPETLPGNKVVSELSKGPPSAAPFPPIPATLPGSEGKLEITQLAPKPQTSQAPPASLFAAQPPIPAFLPGSEGKQVIKPLDKREVTKTQTQKSGLFAAQPPIPAFLPGSEGKQVIKPLNKPEVTKTQIQKSGLFAAQPPIPAFLPGSEGKQVIKPVEKAELTKPQKQGLFAAQPPIPTYLPGSEGKQLIKPLELTKPQKPGLFAAQPPIPTFLPGSEGKQVIKPVEKPDLTKPQSGLFAAQPPIPSFLPGSEGKQVIKPMAKPEVSKPQTEKLGLFAAQPPIPSFLPGSEGKQAIKPLDKTSATLSTSPFGATEPKPSTPASSTVSPFGGTAFGTSMPAFGSSSGAFSGFAPQSPFGFPTTGLGDESGRATPAFGSSPSVSAPAAPVAKPEASLFPSVPKFGEPAGGKPSPFGAVSGGFASFGTSSATGGGSSGFRAASARGFSAFTGPVSGTSAPPTLGSKAAQKPHVFEQGLPSAAKPSTAERKPSSPKRGHSSTDLQAEGEASVPVLDQGHFKRTAVRTASRGPGAAAKGGPPERRNAAAAPDLEAEFLKELEEVQRMAADLEALLAPLKTSAADPGSAALSRNSLEGLFRNTSALYQSCLELREQTRRAGERVQGLMADTHQADAWRIVLESKVEQARDERFRVLWDKKGLEPKAEAQRKALQTKDQALKRRVTDLQIHLQTLELQHRPAVKEGSGRRPGGFHRKDRMNARKDGAYQQKEQNGPSVQSLYSTINTQMAVAQEQAFRLTHLMSQLGLSDSVSPLKKGAQSTPRAEEILRSLDISPARRSPNDAATGSSTRRTPQSSGGRSIRPGTGTIFRVPDYDDVSGDLTPSKTPLPKQRLTYSSAANGGAGKAGTVTPESGRNGGTPGSGGRTPQSERRVAREGLSQYHAPTTTIKRGGPAERAQQPPSPVAYLGARRPDLAPQLSEEDSQESFYTEDEEEEYEERQEDQRRSRRNPHAFEFSDSSSGGMPQSPTTVPAQPPQAQTKFSGVATSSANGPPKAKPGISLGSGQTLFQTPPAGQATAGRSGSVKRGSEGLVHASSKPFEPAGQGAGFGGFEGATKPQTGFGGFGGGGILGSSAFGQPSSGFSLSKETTSVANRGAADSKPAPRNAAPAPPMLSPAFTASPTFAGFEKPASSSSKAAPGAAPEFRFDTSGSKLASALSAPAAASQSGLFSAYSSGGRKETELTSEVELTSVVSAPAQPGRFSAFSGLSESVSNIGEARKRETEKRERGRGVSNVETISDDEGSSADEGVSDEEGIGNRERISDQANISQWENTDGHRSRKGEQVPDSRKPSASESLKNHKEPEENKGQVAPGEAATSAPPSFSPFGGAASAFSSFAKTSKPFGFTTEKEGASDGSKPPNLFGPQTTSPSIFGSGKPSGSQLSDKPPNPFGAPPPDSSEPLSFSLSLAPEKKPEKEAAPADKPSEEAPSVSAKLGKEQESSQAGESARESTAGQGTEQGTKQDEQPADGTTASAEPSGSTSAGGALDTENSGQASKSALVARPASSPLFQIPQMLEAPEAPQTPQTPAAAPSSPITSPIMPQQPPATPFSSTAPPTFTLPSPVASPFSAPAGVNASSPFAFAQSQTQTQSITQSVTQLLTQPSSQPAPQEKEESMDEEDTSGGALSGFGGFGGFGLGSATPIDPSKPNPFGVTSFPSPGAAPQAAFAPPSDPNALFKPASFALPGGSSPFAPSTPSGFGKPSFGTASAFGQPSTGSAFGQANTGSAFGQANTGSAFGQSPTTFGQAASPGFGGSGFGSPGQIGAAPSSNQVIGGIVGGFGQTRTLGPALPGVTAAPAFGSAPTVGAFGSFATKPSGGFGGFASQSTGGGFAVAASPTAPGFGGFGGAAGGGFSSFAGAAPQGGGFGALGGSPGFGGPPAGGDPRFTQIRK